MMRWSESLEKDAIFSALLVAIFATTIYAYWPGLNGIFLVDDGVNLAPLSHNGGVNSWENFLAFVFGNNSGLLGRPIAMMSFLIDDQYYPGSVHSYRYTNLMIHCLCGLFTFLFVRMLICSVYPGKHVFANRVAIFAVAWWLLAPLHVSTTLYVVQRMTQLSALFCLIGLSLFLFGRSRLTTQYVKARLSILVGLYFFGLLAVLSKESGALIFLFALVVEKFIAYCTKEKSDAFVLSVVCLPLLFGALYFLFNWQGLTATNTRDFTTAERLLTELRILWDYVLKIVLPISGKMGLVHDDVLVSRTLFDPFVTFIAVMGHIILAAIAMYFRRVQPWFFLSLFGFYAGHVMESTVIPLELYFEHRNYLPSIFVCIGISVFFWSNYKGKYFRRIMMLCILLGAVAVTSQRAAIWGNPRLQVSIWAAEHSNSLRAQTIYLDSLVSDRRYADAEVQLVVLQKKWPEAAHLFLIHFNESCLGHMKFPYVQADLYKAIQNGRYDGSLPATFERTFELYRGGVCGSLDDHAIEALLEAVANVSHIPNVVRAQFAFLEMEYHGRKGDLDSTIKSLNKAYRYQRNNYILFIKAGVFYSAGLHQLALEEIDGALENELKKAFIFQRNITRYNKMKENITTSIKMERLSESHHSED